MSNKIEEAFRDTRHELWGQYHSLCKLYGKTLVEQGNLLQQSPVPGWELDLARDKALRLEKAKHLVAKAIQELGRK